MPDVDMSMFDQYSIHDKIPPEVQAQRDMAGTLLANEYGDRTPAEDSRDMRIGTQKGQSVPAITTIKPNVDLSMFDAPEQHKPEPDLSMFAEGGGPSNVAKMTSGAMAAVDFLAPVGTAVGGISALGGLAMDTLTGQDNKLDRAVKRAHQYDEWNPIGIAKELGASPEYVESKIAQVPMEKLDELARWVGDQVHDVTGSAGLAAQSYVGVQALTVGLLAHGAVKVGGKTIKIPERLKAPPEAEVKPAVAAPVEAVKPAIETIPYEKVGIPEVGTELGAAPPKPAYESIPYEPRVEKLQGEAATPLSLRDAGVDRPMDMQLDLLPKEETPKPIESNLELAPDAEYQFKQDQKNLLTDPLDAALEKPGFQRDAIEKMTVDEFNNHIRRVNKGTFGQSGALDFSAFKITNDFQKTLVDSVVKGFSLLRNNWPRFAENTDVKVLDYPSFSQRARDKARPNLENTVAYLDRGDNTIYLNIDHPTLALAPPKEVAGIIAHELTHGFQVGRQRFEKQGWNSPDQWAKEWKDRPWEQQAEQARATVGRRLNKGTFGQSGGVDLRQAGDFRPWDNLKATLGFDEKPLKSSEDIGKLNRAFNVAPVMAQITKGRAGDILNNMFTRTKEWHNQGTQKYADAVSHLEPLSKLPRRERLQIQDVAIKFDGINNPQLQAAGLQWLDKTMLQAEGLNARQIHAYEEQTRGIDKAYDMIDETLKAAGQDPVTRIPGYFPHFWSGSYRLKLVAGNKDIAMQAFATRWQRNWVAKQLRKQGQTVLEIDPTSHIEPNNISASIIEGIEIFKARKGLGKPLLDMLIQFDEMSKRGIIKSALERESNLAGFDAEQGITNNWTHNNKMLDAYRSHIEASSKFWTNGQIARDVYAPYLNDLSLFKDTPHLKATISEFVQRNTGQPVNHLSWIDEGLRQVGISAGLPPNTLPGLVQGLGAFMTFAKLIFPNPRFLAAQLVQPIAAAADLSLFHEARRVAGLPLGNPIKAWSVLLKETATPQMELLRSADQNRALQWAKDNNKIDVYTADHINPVHAINALATTHDTAFYQIPRWIENRGRAAAFLANYSYFRDFMPETEARHAAANSTDINMGNYEAGNSASMFTDLGILGRATRPFALIRNAYMGKALMAVQLAKDGIKSGQPMAMTPLGLMLGSYLLVAGGTGMFGANEYDLFARYMNTTFKPEKPWKRPGEFMREHGLPNWAIYGALGDALGMDIGPSLGAPSMTELAGIPALSAGTSAFKLATELLKDDSNSQTIYAALKPVAPNLLQEPMENWVASKQGGNIPGATSFDATIRRTEKERDTLRYTGARAISEVEQRTVNSLYKSNIVNTEKWKADMTSRIVDSMLSQSEVDTGKLVQQALSANRGFDSESLTSAINAEMRRRFLEQKLRDLSEISNSNNVANKPIQMVRMKRLQRPAGAMNTQWQI